MTRKLQLPQGNIALAALQAHKAAHAAKTVNRATPGTDIDTIVPAGNPTTQPLPAARQVHLCVVCHTNNPTSTTRGTWVTNIGHVLCDDHKLEHDQTGHLPIMRKLHP